MYHSGELLYRRNQAEAKDLVGKCLQGLLDQGAKEDAVIRGWNSTHSLMSSALSRLRHVAGGDLSRLAVVQGMIKSRIAVKLQAVKGLARRHEDIVVADLRDLDRRIMSLVMQYMGVLEEERHLATQRLQRQNRACDADLELAGLIRDLNFFGLHLEYETQGKIQVRRLSPSHPQAMRCRRAATENLKPHFFGFDPCCPYDGVKVLDVFKVENSYGLDRFQAAAMDSRSGKVKGLFCSVPRECLEHLIVYGFTTSTTPSHHHAAQGGRKWDSSSSSSAVFKDSWFQVPRGASTASSSSERRGQPPTIGGKGEGGYASLMARAARPVSFPRCFSRYSTFEENKGDILRDAEARSSLKRQQQQQGGKNNNHHHAQDGDDDGGGGEEDEEDSGLRVLVLCRVLLGKIYVSGEAIDRAVADMRLDKAPQDFDSIYSSEDEEYRLLNPDYVLPEFIMLYRYTAKPSSRCRRRPPLQGSSSSHGEAASRFKPSRHDKEPSHHPQQPAASSSGNSDRHGTLRTSAFPLACYQSDLAKSVPRHHHWTSLCPSNNNTMAAPAHDDSATISSSSTAVPPPPPPGRRAGLFSENGNDGMEEGGGQADEEEEEVVVQHRRQQAAILRAVESSFAHFWSQQEALREEEARMFQQGGAGAADIAEVWDAAVVAGPAPPPSH